MRIEHAALIVDDYDAAIRFFVDALGFEPIEDSLVDERRPAEALGRSSSGRRNWPPARAGRRRASTRRGRSSVRRPGRVFLRVDDFDTARQRMLDHGVPFVTEPRDEPYGRLAVFVDVAGNRWDLLGPRPAGHGS